MRGKSQITRTLKTGPAFTAGPVSYRCNVTAANGIPLVQLPKFSHCDLLPLFAQSPRIVRGPCVLYVGILSFLQMPFHSPPRLTAAARPYSVWAARRSMLRFPAWRSTRLPVWTVARLSKSYKFSGRFLAGDLKVYFRGP